MNRAKWVLTLVVFGVVCLGMAPGIAYPQETEALPLSAIGPYNMVGRQEFSFVDATRDRTVTGYIWYPAGYNPKARPGPIIPKDNLPPDTSAAPYPLIIYSHGRSQDGVDAGTTLGAAQHLASYGFAVLSIQHRDPAIRQINWMDRPMDILFVLNQLAATSGENELVGLMDLEHVGITGFSLGASTALLFSGARIDPASRDEYCTTAEKPGPLTCDISDEIWQQMLDERAHVEPFPVEGEPWPPYTDDRILAVMPVAPCHGPFWGERGLASASVPTLIIGLEKDERCTYERDALYMYEHLGSTDRALLTVFNQKHDDAFLNRNPQKIFNHFAVAFFGYHLQGKSEYAQYLTADFVSGFDNLEWASSAD
jgi:predicted dienelactone hydrolase